MRARVNLSNYNDPWQSGRMLLLLDYLQHIINERKYIYPTQLDEAGYWTPEKSMETNRLRASYRSE
jgi:hypothetical protein